MFTELLLLIISVSPARADIVGGLEVQDNDPIRSSTVGLYTPSPDGHGGALCTASLIASDTAVTAAHCISPGSPAPVVLFGRDLHSRETIAKPVDSARVNPDWARKRGRGMDQGDIALVHFKKGLPAGYHKIGMARSEAAMKRGTPAVLAGYGISDRAANSGSGVLRKTRVRILDPRKGKPEMVFDQSHGHGACHGDSGGPAIVEDGHGRQVLAGVTNRSHPATAPDDCAHRVVYTKVGAYRDWIKRSEKELRDQRQRSGARRQLASRVAKPLRGFGAKHVARGGRASRVSSSRPARHRARRR